MEESTIGGLLKSTGKGQLKTTTSFPPCFNRLHTYTSHQSLDSCCMVCALYCWPRHRWWHQYV